MSKAQTWRPGLKSSCPKVIVDLGNPNQTDRAGFTATSAKPGDAITVLGNRHLDKTKMQIKAVRITIAGKNYDMYPERIRTN